MSDAFDSGQSADPAAAGLSSMLDNVRTRTSALGVSASTFASAMTKAFTDATVGGKQFDDVLKSMGLRLSSMAVQQAFKPIAKDIAGGLKTLLGSIFGPDVIGTGGGRGGGGTGNGGGCSCGCNGGGMTFMPTNGCCNCGNSGGVIFDALPALFSSNLKSVFPFASGGVIGAPTYFPLASGGFGLAGEAGPEAIMPLTRGSDGTLGVAMAGAGAPANITVQIATPDAASFKRSEAYITGQIARAVARGQRSL